jgi:hypothetical protein
VKLTKEFPLPWLFTAFDNHENGAWEIRAANGEQVMDCADYTGDGATIRLSTQQAREMCDLINLVGGGE